MRANMDKQPAPASGTTRDKVFAYDLQGPFEPSKFGGNRYIVNFVVYDNGNCTWFTYYLVSKDRFPEALATFLDTGDYRGFTPLTDNEAVLNSGKVKGMFRRRGFPIIRHACEFSPWENPSERPLPPSCLAFD